MAKDALVSENLASEVRHREGLPLHPVGRRRGTGHHRRPLRARPAHGRAQAVGAARRPRRVHQPRGHPHLERLLRLRDPGRRQARAAAAAVRGDDPRPRRPRLDQGVERRRRRGHLRVAGRLAVRDPAQRQPPALQRLRPAGGALRLLDEHAAGASTCTTTSTSSSAPRTDFPSRFNGEPDYFAPKGEQKGLLLDTNFVADAVNLPLIEAKERGAGGGHIRFAMAKGSMNSHISQFPIATYKKGHRHGPGAHVIILSGEGYSLMWPEGEEPRRYEWGPGTLIVPPNMWFHQHFNTGTEPGRYLAFKHEVVSVRNAQGVPKAWISQRIGGDQIDYADESPVRARDLPRGAGRSTACEPQMDAAYEAELATLPPSRLSERHAAPRRRGGPTVHGPHTVPASAPADARHGRARSEHGHDATASLGHEPDHDHAHDDEAAEPARGQPDLAAGQRHAAQRRHGHRLLRHPGRLLPAAPAAHRRGADQPLRRGPPGDAVPLRRSTLTPYASAEQIDAEALGAIIDRGLRAPRGSTRRRRHRRGDPHRRGAAAAQRRGDRRRARRAGRRAGHRDAPATTWRRCSPPTARARRRRRTTAGCASSTSTSAAARRSSRCWTAGGSSRPRRCTSAAGCRSSTTAGRIVRLDPAGRRARRARRLRAGSSATAVSRERDRARSRADDGGRARRRPHRRPGPAARRRRAAASPSPLARPRRDRRRHVLRRRRRVRLRPREPAASATSAGRSAGRCAAGVDAGALPLPLLPAGECIRATALGASEYSVQLSGNTGCVTDPDALLPRRNLQVVRPAYELGEEVDAAAVAGRSAATWSRSTPRRTDADVALALTWSGRPRYDRLLAVRDAACATGSPSGSRAAGRVYVVLDGDVALTLGRLLRDGARGRRRPARRSTG